MILKAEFYNNEEALVAIAVPDANNFVDLVDELRTLQPDALEVFDGELISLARTHGKRYNIFSLVDGESATPAVIAGLVLCSFRDFSERVRKRKFKKHSSCRINMAVLPSKLLSLR